MYFCEIVEGKPRAVEPEKTGIVDWYSYDDLLRLKEDDVLVPNMCKALPENSFVMIASVEQYLFMIHSSNKWYY